MSVIDMPIDIWDTDQLAETLNWLQEAYGPSRDHTWYIDYNPMRISLVMSQEVYFFWRAAHDY